MIGLKNKHTRKDGVEIISSEVDKDAKIRIAILIPHTYPNYTSDFFLTITAILSLTYHWNYTQRDGKYAFDLVTPPRNFAGIDKIREGLASIALREGADYMMWMDSDQLMPPDTIVKMIKHFEEAEHSDLLKGLEGVGALITYKSPPYLPHIYVKKHKDGKTYHMARNFALNQLSFVEGMGFGCCMIKSTVFNRIEKPWFKIILDDKGHFKSGEDLGFCLRADMKLVLDPTIVVKHQELTSFDISNYLVYNDLEVKDGRVDPSVEKSNAIYNEHLNKPKSQDTEYLKF